MTAAAAFDALVLAGGAGRRMRSDTPKIDLAVGGITMLGRALAAVAGAGVVVVVGPRRSVSRPVIFSTEEPAGSGPAAAIVHGLQFVTADVVVVLAADVPFARAAVPKLLAAVCSQPADAAMVTDASGRRQPLLAAYRTDALRRAASGRAWAGEAVRSLTEGLVVVEVAATGSEALDCDTPDQLDIARGAVSGEL